MEHFLFFLPCQIVGVGKENRRYGEILSKIGAYKISKRFSERGELSMGSFLTCIYNERERRFF